MEDHFTRCDVYVQVFNSIDKCLYNSLDSLRSEKRLEVYNTKLRRTCAHKCRDKTVIYGQKAA